MAGLKLCYNHHVRRLIILIFIAAISIYGLALWGGQPFGSVGKQTLHYAKQGIDKLVAWGEGTSPESTERRIEEAYELTNVKRKENGLLPLQRSEELENLAKIHAQNMYDRKSCDHLGFNERSDKAQMLGFNLVAENCAEGGYEASSFIDMWLTSPGHRANLLDPGLTHIGIGIYGEYAVQLFGGY